MLFGIIGGDRRQEVLLDLLRKDGYPVAAYGVAGEADWENAVTAEVVILPLPLCREGDTLNMEGEQRGVGALFHRLRRDQLILAGQVKPAQRTEALELDLNLIDYFKKGRTNGSQCRRHSGGNGSGHSGVPGTFPAGEPGA